MIATDRYTSVQMGEQSFDTNKLLADKLHIPWEMYTLICARTLQCLSARYRNRRSLSFCCRRV